MFYAHTVKKAVLVYGICGGLLIVALKLVEYRYFKLQPGFAEKYSAYMIEHLQASGASPEAIEAGRRQMRELKVMLDNPLMNSAMTFTEPFPIGLAVTLISAAVLRKKRT